MGNTTTIRTDTIVTSVDIGQLGSTSWDFSFLTPNPAYDFVITVVDPNSTPYIGDFPGSNIATKSQVDIMGLTADIYSYLSINGSFNSHGSVMEADTILVTTTSNPIEPLGISPFTFGSTVDYDGERTTVMEITGFPPFTTMTTVISNSVVDAYGPMTLPGGRVVDALRIKEDEINIIQDPFPFYSRTISYTFLAKDGSQVSVPSDTIQAETGVINNTASVSWNDALVTSIRLEETIPDNYTLKQNYPNPFNPSTNIEYSIPSESFVELKVYDILGNEVVSLVNEQQQAGVYRAEFTADNLPSGMYFARITANEFTKVVKMILLR
ncbi:MAG: T9SS type A sorting domain-containing protein [Bacteroidetes bacterium]|nr:T9SS type A sorting domain-containing protein [Bacteroidota bacterium]